MTQHTDWLAVPHLEPPDAAGFPTWRRCHAAITLARPGTPRCPPEALSIRTGTAAPRGVARLGVFRTATAGGATRPANIRISTTDRASRLANGRCCLDLLPIASLSRKPTQRRLHLRER